VGEVGIDPPIAHLVRIRERRAVNRLAEADVVEFVRLGRQAGFDVTQALPIGQLREGHGPELLGARQRTHRAVATITADDPRKRAPRQEIHQLREQCLAGVHGPLLPG
jgi:hypothetical protein